LRYLTPYSYKAKKPSFAKRIKAINALLNPAVVEGILEIYGNECNIYHLFLSVMENG